MSGSEPHELVALMDDFTYVGIETCAADGLCATACPVGINTGDHIKHLRAASVKNENIPLWIADHFAVVERALGWGVRAGHVAEKVIGVQGVKSISLVAEKITGTVLPKWNRHVPAAGKISHKQIDRGASTEFIYFPSCISRQLSKPATGKVTLADTLLTVAERAGISLRIPSDTEGHCCGMPFASKGYVTAYQAMLHRTLLKFWDWSMQGKYPIVIDTTSCTHTLLTCSADLSEEDRTTWKQLTILDGIDFLHGYVLPRLDIQPLDEEVILHPNCSARKLGLDVKLAAIARQCASSVTVPLHLNCCGFAGDRGLLYPELTASATEQEAAEVNARDYDGYYSSNITCEMGMSEATGKDYLGIVYLVEQASRAN
jgi:D-lactate dehydrogenase